MEQWQKQILQMIDEIDRCIKEKQDEGTTPGRVFYFYHDCTRYWKYVRPVRRL